MNKRKEISPTVDKPASKIRNITKSPLHMKPEMDSGTECDIGSPTNIKNMLLERITNLTTSIDPQDLREKFTLTKSQEIGYLNSPSIWKRNGKMKLKMSLNFLVQ